ncbi:MAG: hypothetical protein DWI45_02385 [Chloroflexi bacterium]|nr:MAG: hypothetical protein DWI45_02385 [Chloroflexota bacterium]
MRTIYTALLAAMVALSALGCSTAPPDGSLPCDASIDVQRAIGFDASLEALLPLAGWGSTPAVVDSARECSEKRLGPLWGAGIRELRSAGAQFDTGDQTGYTLVIYRADGLTLASLSAAFEAGASVGRKTQDIRITAPQLRGRPSFRMVLLNGDHRQVITLFQAPGEAEVRGVLASDISDAAISDAVERYAAATE